MLFRSATKLHLSAASLSLQHQQKCIKFILPCEQCKHILGWWILCISIYGDAWSGQPGSGQVRYHKVEGACEKLRKIVRGLQGVKKDGGGHSRAYQNGIGFTLIDQAVSVNIWSCTVPGQEIQCTT